MWNTESVRSLAAVEIGPARVSLVRAGGFGVKTRLLALTSLALGPTSLTGLGLPGPKGLTGG
jgi:hypothetical protein